MDSLVFVAEDLPNKFHRSQLSQVAANASPLAPMTDFAKID